MTTVLQDEFPLRVPFAMPDIGEAEIAEVVDTLRGGWLTTGPKVRCLEEEFAAFLGGGVHAVAVSSATAGLSLALDGAGVGAGDEVITTTYTFTATAEAAVALGARPVLVDIDPETLCVDPDAVEAVVTERTRAIVPVHMGGMACDMARILARARARGIAVIEDAAHAFPARSGECLVGSLESDAAVFSFYATKPVAAGEGGMVVTRDAAAAGRYHRRRLHGIDRDAFRRAGGALQPWAYDVVERGYKCNMGDIAASLAIVQLRRAWSMHRRRLEIATFYDGALGDLPVHLPPRPARAQDHAWHLYVIRLRDDAPATRDEFIRGMRRAGVVCGVHFIPLHRMTYWREALGHDAGAFPAAEEAFRTVVSLPIHSRMSLADQEIVANAARTLLA